MDETTTDPTQDGSESTIPRKRRKRTGRKRTVFQPPVRPAPAVRELWRQATSEERERAHETCVLMLEYWLGKKAKEEVASELGLPQLRVWQLSQQALSGMLAGLLKQPRRRRSAASLAALPPGDDPRVLRKRIAALEASLKRTEDQVRVLRTAPWMQGAAEEKGRSRARATKRRGTAKKAVRPRISHADRSADPVPPARPSDDGCAG